MGSFGDRVGRTELALGSAAVQAAAERDEAAAARFRANVPAAEAFARLLEDVGRTLVERRVRPTTWRIQWLKDRHQGKPELKLTYFRELRVSSWILMPGAHHPLWLSVDGSLWSDALAISHAGSFSYLGPKAYDARRVGDPRPVQYQNVYAVRAGNSKGPISAVPTTVLPRDVSWALDKGFRLRYTASTGRDSSQSVDVDYEQALAEAVAKLD